MTKRDYIAIAQALHDATNVFHAATLIAEVMKKDNPRFDNEKFARYVMEGK